MMQSSFVLFTKEGYDALKRRYHKLKARRPTAVLELKRGREMGDLSENGLYKAARLNLSTIDRQLHEMARILALAKVIRKKKSKSVDIGNSVTLRQDDNEITYTIVGEYEANPSEQKISFLSPLGSKLIGKKVGDTCVIITTLGETLYTISSIN